MLILLDENFPLQLHHRLRSTGYDVEHIIILGQRGLPDVAIRHRLASEDMLLLTQDTEFAILPAHVRGKVILSRVSQSRPIMDRVDLWFRALEAFLIDPPTGHVLEVFDSGVVAAVRMGEHTAPEG